MGQTRMRGRYSIHFHLNFDLRFMCIFQSDGVGQTQMRGRYSIHFHLNFDLRFMCFIFRVTVWVRLKCGVDILSISTLILI